MDTKYDPTHIAGYYDSYGEREWVRFETDPAGIVNLHLHQLYLRRYIRAGDHVLEAGAGPGRFTIELGRLGARVTVGDISPVQLELNRKYVGEAGLEECVVARHALDITDLSSFPSAAFDAVVCIGGVLSYALDRGDRALGELLRVTRPGGYLLLSVMSLIGSTRAFLPGILEVAAKYGLDAVQAVQSTGDLYGEVTPRGHHCHMYRWAELQALFSKHPCTLVAASASNFLSLGNEEVLREVMSNAETWEAFLGWEEEYCREPGALDGGTHIIAVVRREA